MLQDVQYQFQLRNDTYELLSEKFRKLTLCQFCWQTNLTNIWLWVDNNHTCDHLVDASIQIIRYLNDPQYRFTDSQISPYTRLKILRDLNPQIINFLWELVTHESY